MADQAKGKGIAPKRASNLANPGQSSRPLPPIRTLSEDKEDGEDYSKVIEVLKQHIKSYKRDSVSAIKNISSTLASLTNSSDTVATTTGKTSYRPAVDNTGTSNLAPPIDIGSKEGFKDTITSSIVKELSQKAYTILDNSKLSGESNFEQWIQALKSKFPSWVSRQKSSIRQARMLGLIASSLNIEYLMADILEESRNPAIKAYKAAYMANSSNSTPNSNSNPSKKGKNKKKGKKKASYNIKGQNYSAKSAEQASFILGCYNLAIEEEEESDSSSNSTGIGSITLEVLSRKAPPTYTKLVLDNVLYLPNIDINIVSRVRHYNSGGCIIKETLYRGNRRCIAVLDFKKSGFFLNVKGSSKPILHANFAFPLGLTGYNTTKNIELQRNKIVVEIPSNSIRKEDYRPIIEDAIVSKAIEPNKRYKLRNSPAKGTTLEGIGPSLRGKRPYRPTREPKPLTGTGDLPRVLREPVIEGNKVEKAISSPTLKEPNIVLSQPTDNTALEGELVDLDLDLEGAVSPDPSNLNTKKPLSIEIGPSKPEPYESSSDSKLDEPLPDKPINPVIVDSTRPTISIRKPELPEAFPQTIEPIFAPKPIEVIAPNQPITNEPLKNSDLMLEGDKIQLDYYKLLAKTSSYILSFVYKARKRVISKDSTPTTYKQVLKLPRDERSKWLEAITKEFIQLLELGVFKFLPRIARGFIQVEGLDYTITYASTSILPTWHILLAIGAVLDWEIEQADFIGAFLNSALRKEIYIEIPKGLLDLAASTKAIDKLLLKYSYNPSTPNIIKLSKALYSLKQSPREWQDKLKILLKSLGYLPLILDPGVFYNAKTCHFIITYIDDCLFTGPNIGYITDLKKGLNKVYAIEDLEPAAYFLGVQIIRDRPNRRL
ncbi:hypothetical protein P8C59_000016 [Phyllachora maydis]|uniref:Reverse transcriptase Ty1/copia-type domain-containing protein n=1 Tax=Phyllachora maydis TaxID=1825666 RepID=A0AAD9MAQ4_9PEZI|nr:hypothetical protein P8C59_000016 [Phyllachora maydis]